MTSTGKRLFGLAGGATAALVVCAFAAFAWPTLYRYDRIQMLGENAPGPEFPVRVNRITGEVEILLPQMLLDSRHNMQLSWVGLTGERLPSHALEALRDDVIVDAQPTPFAQILNTSGWRLTKLRWQVVTAGGATGQTTRHFDSSVFIEPHSVGSIYLDLGRFGHGASISLQDAWGTEVRTD